jgi:serine/threonine protein kinase
MRPVSERVKEIFAQALQRKTAAERESFLAKACQGDGELRQEVETLLRANDDAGDFLGQTIKLPMVEFESEPIGGVIGRYKLLEKIGEGGFGVVYMAEQQEPVQRKVALKIIKAGMDTREVIARFEAERQALALMDHPNIAKVLDAGTTDAKRPYFVMELVRGIPITDYCDEKNLSTTERLQLFIKVCQAVQHAHQKAVIHRDLKPSNILVTLHDSEPLPKVIDFGVAKALGQKLTEKTLFTSFRQMIGTPAYMSPEQAEMSGLDIDTRSDIYSLGVLLYELLTGVTPFDKELLAKAALDEIRRLIRETEPPKPSTRLRALGEKITDVAKHRQTEPKRLSQQVQGDLDWIVMRCLEKDRSRRYETANGIALDVRRYLQQEPVSAVGPSPSYRFRKFLRRNRMPLAISALAGLLITSFIALSIIIPYQAKLRRALDQSRIARAEADALRRKTEAIISNTESNYSRWLSRVPNAVEVRLDDTTPRVDLCGLMRVYGTNYACFVFRQATQTNFGILGVGERIDLVEVLGFDPTNLNVTVMIGKRTLRLVLGLPPPPVPEPNPLAPGAVWFAFDRAPLDLVLDAYLRLTSRILIRVDETPHLQLTAQMSTPKESHEAENELEQALARSGVGMVAINKRLTVVGTSAFLGKANLTLADPSFPVPAAQREYWGSLYLPDAPLGQTALIYAQLAGRTLVESDLDPDRRVRIQTSGKLTRFEAIQVLGTCLQLYGVKPVPLGDTLIRMVPLTTPQLRSDVKP